MVSVSVILMVIALVLAIVSNYSRRQITLLTAAVVILCIALLLTSFHVVVR